MAARPHKRPVSHMEGAQTSDFHASVLAGTQDVAVTQYGAPATQGSCFALETCGSPLTKRCNSPVYSPCRAEPKTCWLCEHLPVDCAWCGIVSDDTDPVDTTLEVKWSEYKRVSCCGQEVARSRLCSYCAEIRSRLPCCRNRSAEWMFYNKPESWSLFQRTVTDYVDTCIAHFEQIKPDCGD